MANLPIASYPSSSRTDRYAIRIPVIFRPLGGGSWYEGWTQNVSASGMLLHVEEDLHMGSTLEMAFTLALNRKEGVATRVSCSGKVVRSAKPGAEAGFMVGIRILDFTLARLPESPRRRASGSAQGARSLSADNFLKDSRIFT